MFALGNTFILLSLQDKVGHPYNQSKIKICFLGFCNSILEAFLVSLNSTYNDGHSKLLIYSQCETSLYWKL